MALRSLVPYSWGRNMPSETRYDPFVTLQQEMNRLFESFGSFPSLSNIMPRLDVVETDKEIDIDAEIPGMQEKDIDITLAGNVLTIHGEKKNGHEEKGKNYHLSERSYGSFTRTLTLPFDADPKRVNARCENGILHIAIPKPDNMSKAAKIPVRAT